jgi:hypothetical protein
MSTRRISVASAIVVASIGLVSVLYAQTTPATQPAGVTGTWKWSFEGPGGQTETTLTLKQEGDKLTGTVTGFGGEDQAIQDGKVKGDEITFKVTRDWGGNTVTTTYTGKVAGDSLKGKSETVFAREFDAKRSK